MKAVVSLPLLFAIAVVATLTGCEKEPTEEELLANKPTIFSMGVDTQDLLAPADHPNVNETRVFNEFGLPVDSGSSEGGRKNLAHPEFYNERGTQVTAVSNGKVRDIFELDGEDDVLIMVTPDDADLWTIGYEHVSNMQVSVGDQVTLGQYIADFSPQNDQVWTTAAKTALMIFYDNGDRDKANLTICPFDVLDTNAKQQIQIDIQAHIDEWETARSANTYDQAEWFSFGCYTEFADG
jgi:hypothetical protein